MTATDELRRMLDELRKLACDINEEEIRSHSIITLNQGRYNRQFRLDMNHDWLNAWHAEFERILQAIAATLYAGGVTKVDAVCNGCHAHVSPDSLSHTRPDGLERIADELEAWCDRVDVDGAAAGKPRDLAERIRKLAKKEAER